MSKVHEVVRRDLTFRVSTVPLVAGVTSGFVPATRRKVFVKLQPLVVPNCFFVNLPKRDAGTGLTADGMKKCVCVRPEAVALSGQMATICVMRNLPDFATIRTRGVSRKSLLAKDSLCSS